MSPQLRALAVLAAIVILACAGFTAYEIVEQPTNPLFGPAVVAGPPRSHVIALTYDDGPNPPYTNAILRVLEQEGVHATFFVVGRAAQAYPAVLRRELRDGDAIGNHSWDHAHLIVLPASAVKRSLQRTDAAVFAATGVHMHLMRPPFGARDWSVMRTAQHLGYTVVLWNVPLARDWEYPPAHVIAQRVLDVAKDGSILVLHDGNRGIVCAHSTTPRRTCDRSQDISATRAIVRALKEKGYRFVTIPQLIALDRQSMRKRGLAVR